MKTTFKFCSTTAVANLWIALLALVIFSGGLIVGVFLFQYITTNTNASEESVDLASCYFWGGNNWTEAGIVAVNNGEKEIRITNITVSSIECNWNAVYYWTTGSGPISSELNHTGGKLSGSSFDIVVGGLSRNFQQVDSELSLKERWTIVLYIRNPGGIEPENVPSRVAIAIFTENKMYYEDVDTEVTFTFTKTEQFNVVSVSFGGTSGDDNNYITVRIQNTGNSSFVIDTTAKVNAATETVNGTLTDRTLNAGSYNDVRINAVDWLNGYQYSIELITTQGTKIPYVANAPGT